MGIPEITKVMIGTNASGTLCHHCKYQTSRCTTSDTHRNVRHAFRLAQHPLQDTKEVFSRDLSWSNTQGIYIGTRSVDAEPI